MSRYTPVGSTPVSPSATATPSRRSSVQSARRPSFSSSFFSRQQNRIPDPDEMDAAFDAPPDVDDDENAGLLGRQQEPERRADRIPGDYDFERDYVSLALPPSIPTQITCADCCRRCRLIHHPRFRTTLLTTLLQATPTVSSPQMSQLVHHLRVVISSEASYHPRFFHGNNHPLRMEG